MRISSVGATTFTYTVLTVRMGVVLYGRTSYINDNILTFLRFSRNDYYSICLDYCNSSNFEQIIKAPHYALPSYVVFYHNLYGSTHFCGSHFLSLLYRHFLILSNAFFIFWPLRHLSIILFLHHIFLVFLREYIIFPNLQRMLQYLFHQKIFYIFHQLFHISEIQFLCLL